MIQIVIKYILICGHVCAIIFHVRTNVSDRKTVLKFCCLYNGGERFYDREKSVLCTERKGSAGGIT